MNCRPLPYQGSALPLSYPGPGWFRAQDMVGRGGFEPPKAEPTDLQSVPFGHSGTPPFFAWNDPPQGSLRRLPDRTCRPDRAGGPGRQELLLLPTHPAHNNPTYHPSSISTASQEDLRRITSHNLRFSFFFDLFIRFPPFRARKLEFSLLFRHFLPPVLPRHLPSFPV